MISKSILLKASIFFLLILSVAGCTRQNKDVTIKTDLAVKAKYELDFVGVTFTVDNRIVTLNGNCATEKARAKVFSTVKNLYAVKGVINNIQIAPVVIGTDLLLKQAVDSILRNYTGVEAITKDSIVYLKGKIKSGELNTLRTSINSLNPRKVEQQLEQY